MSTSDTKLNDVITNQLTITNNQGAIMKEIKELKDELRYFRAELNTITNWVRTR